MSKPATITFFDAPEIHRDGTVVQISVLNRRSGGLNRRSEDQEVGACGARSLQASVIVDILAGSDLVHVSVGVIKSPQASYQGWFVEVHDESRRVSGQLQVRDPLREVNCRRMKYGSAFIEGVRGKAARSWQYLQLAAGSMNVETGDSLEPGIRRPGGFLDPTDITRRDSTRLS